MEGRNLGRSPNRGQRIGMHGCSRPALWGSLVELRPHRFDAITWIVAGIVGFPVLYFVVNGAVRNALDDHYKSVRHFEETGEWRSGTWSRRTRPMRPAGRRAD